MSKVVFLTVPKFFVGDSLSFRKFLVSEILKEKRGLSFITVDFSCLTVPENFVKEQYCVSENFWYRKILCRRGGITTLCGKFFVSEYRKFRRGILVFQKNCGIKKLHKMVYHGFVGNGFSHSTEKVRRGSLHFSGNFFYRKSLSVWGGYHDLLPKLFCLTVPKKFLGGPFCFWKFLD